MMEGSWHRVVAWLAVLGIAGWGLAIAPAVSASGATEITDCSSASIANEVSSDFAAGGTYDFDCAATSTIALAGTITPGASLTVTNSGAAVVLGPASGYVGRFMTIDSGQTVSLSGIGIEGWLLQASAQPAANGADGTAGTCGAVGASLSGGVAGNGGNGGNAVSAGTPGGPGTDGAGLEQGAALLIDSGTVDLNDDVIAGNLTIGQSGGHGGAGGTGGCGGHGGNAGGQGGNGGNGGNGLPGGDGGSGGNGSSAEGGAIYNAGTLTITDSTLHNNRAQGGNGGYGANGGNGGNSGYGGVGWGAGNGGTGGNGAQAGSAGEGGNGGNAEGGAIYNAGALTLTSDTFTANSTWAGAGGAGGNNPQGSGVPDALGYASGGSNGGEAAGTGVGGDGGTTPGSAGGAGVGGSGGATAGGALFDTSGTAASGNTFDSNTATGPMGLAGPNGGAGGSGDHGGGGGEGGTTQNITFTGVSQEGDPGGDGAAGGNGGDATGGAFESPSNIAHTSTCSANTVTAGAAGAGGAGGFGGGNAAPLTPTFQPSGAAGPPGAAGTASDGQATCADSLTVTVAAPSDSGGPRPGLGASAPITVTVTAPATNHDTVTSIGFTGSAPLQWNPAPAAASGDDSAPAPFNLAPGSSRTFTVHLTIQQLDTVALASAVSGTDPGGSVTAAGADTLYTQSSLQITVTTDPGTPIQLKDTPDGWVAQTVDAIVTVKNVGGAPVTNVAVDKQLVITVAAGTPKVGEIPIDQPANGPTPSTLGNLAPGQSAQSTFALNVRGDGKYDLAAVVDGTDPGGSAVSATGDEVVEIDGPVLVWKASLPNPSNLIKAGDTFLVNVTLENNSYQKTVAVAPIHALLTGNAQDGHLQLQGEAIPGADSTPACDAGEAVTLDPRTSDDMEAVIRTASSDPQLTGTGSDGPSGGTRAEITFNDPAAWFVNDDGTLGAQLDPANDEVIASDSQDFLAHIDDRGFPAQEPKSNFDATVYFSKGLLIGAGQALVGLVHGVFVDLPKLVAHGILGLPHALLAYAQLEADLWNDVRDDPRAQALYLTAIGNAVLLAYKQAPVLEQQAKQTLASVNAAVLSHYTHLWTQWYAGDWKAAAETMGEESGDGITNLGLLLAPCVLAKFPAVAETFQAARAAAYARAAEELSRFPEAVPWLKALAALDKLAPGFEFSNRQLLSFAGLTVDQSDFLRSFAKAHDYLIVARTRAAESVTLLKEGLSVLKPELIKTKTVSQMDIDFLGYSQSELAQVALHDPPSQAFVEARLRSRGFGPGDATWDGVMQRLARRVKEEKYTHELEQIATKGEVTMHFNLSGNVMDPTALDAAPTTYRFRLASGPKGDRIPQFFVAGRWRSVTGDVDFLQITHADGAPLTTAERAQVYREFSSSPVGMLHGESATWQDSASQAFDFPDKINEFTRAGTVVQFGPDGQARAVKFVEGASKFESPSRYYIQWDGGYVFPANAASAATR